MTNVVPLKTAPALAVKELTTGLKIRGTWHEAVRGVSFEVMPRETVALVGESGCGKSLTAMSIMGLLPAKVGKILSGSVTIDGREVVGLPERDFEGLRGNLVSMIFQEPMTSLNPVLPVGFQIAETLRRHRGLDGAAARAEVLRLMNRVQIPASARRIDDYPHQFSGGMRQRVMIAIAVACRPKVLLADEPTTALDVTIQAQVLNLIAELQAEDGMAVLFITHNLGVVASIASRVVVMYGGDVVETGPVDDFFARPSHPYSTALLRSVPRADRRPDSLEPIPGQVPTLFQMPAGCRFQSRCPHVMEVCAERPPLLPTAGRPDHQMRCWLGRPEGSR
jgi:peptide/nickel transport system ATP-binding protein